MRVRSSRSKRFVYGSVCRLSFPTSHFLPLPLSPLSLLLPSGNEMATNSNAINFCWLCNKQGRERGCIFCLRRFDLKQFVKTNIETNIETYIETYIFALSSQRRCSCCRSSSSICIFIYFSDYAASSFNLIYLPIQLGSAWLGCLQLFNMHNHRLCSTNFDKYRNMMSYMGRA